MKSDAPRLGLGLTARHSQFASRPTRFIACFCLAILPAITAAPVSAQQLLPTSSLATDSADLPSAMVRPMLPEAMVMADRNLLMANDLNRLMVENTLANAAVEPAETDNGKNEEEDDRTRGLLQKALALLGTPYRWGGTSPERGFDCSGLVKYVFSHALGIDLPRVSREQARNGEAIKDRDEMAAGDLVFFGRRGRVDHVGIYLGEGRFVHAPSRGKQVSVSRLDSGYWGRKFMQARRIGIDGI